jgi:hypothetical protein
MRRDTLFTIKIRISNDNFLIFSDPWYDSVKDEIKEKEIKTFLNKKRNGENTDEADTVGDRDFEDRFKKKVDEEEKDFAYYGEEDLYYQEEKLTTKELNEIKDEVKANRLKLMIYLKENETVQQAINRLRPSKPQQHKNKKQKVDDIVVTAEDKVEQEKKFKGVLDIVSKLTELSFFDVYTDNREKIESAYGKQSWRYRVKDVMANTYTEYGPYTGSEIKDWYNRKCFVDTADQKFEFNIDGNNEWFSSLHPLFKKNL